MAVEVVVVTVVAGFFVWLLCVLLCVSCSASSALDVASRVVVVVAFVLTGSVRGVTIPQVGLGS